MTGEAKIFEYELPAAIQQLVGVLVIEHCLFQEFEPRTNKENTYCGENVLCIKYSQYVSLIDGGQIWKVHKQIHEEDLGSFNSLFIWGSIIKFTIAKLHPLIFP